MRLLLFEMLSTQLALGNVVTRTSEKQLITWEEEWRLRKTIVRLLRFSRQLDSFVSVSVAIHLSTMKMIRNCFGKSEERSSSSIHHTEMK